MPKEAGIFLGIIGNCNMVKYTVLGTYAGGTSLKADVNTRSRVQ
jgi:hypothetical protein